MFTNIEKNTKWDMSRNMLWGYFFTNQTRKPLEAAAKDLSKMGYRFVDIYLSDKKASDGPQKWWLHVERIETHNVDSLDKRNAELTDFAEQHGLETYDGMDVGPVTQVEGGKK